MPVRRVLLFVFGIWFGGTVLSAWLAATDFGVVDGLLKQRNPQFEELVKPLGHDATRHLLRYQVAEVNRSLFETWSVAQLVFAAGVLLTVLFATSEGRIALGVAAVLVALAAIEQFFVIPRIIGLGRFLDFLGASQGQAERGELGVLQIAYTVMECFKLLTGGILVYQLFRKRARSSSRSKEA